MTRKEYNGWTNYETWDVALWLDNEQGSYNYWRERAEELVNEHDGDKDLAARNLADELKAQHEENAPEVEGIYADLLNAALSEVDWFEIANHYTEEVEYETEEAETEAE